LYTYFIILELSLVLKQESYIDRMALNNCLSVSISRKLFWILLYEDSEQSPLT